MREEKKNVRKMKYSHKYEYDEKGTERIVKKFPFL